MFKKVFFISSILAFTSHYAFAHCGNSECGQPLTQGQVRMHPVDDMSGYVCYPYQFQTQQDSVQTLGFLNGSHEGVTEPHQPEVYKADVFSNSETTTQYKQKTKHKAKKKAKKKAPAPKQEEVKKDAYNDDAKPQSHFNEKEIETKPVENKPVDVTPSQPIDTTPKPAPMSTQQEPSAIIATPIAHPSNNSTSRATVLDFSEREVELSTDQTSILNSLVDDMKNTSDLVAKIHSYGFSTDGNPTEARRKSLQRAIKIRKFLLDKDVNPNRISVNSIDDSKNNLNKVEIMLEDGRS